MGIIKVNDSLDNIGKFDKVPTLEHYGHLLLESSPLDNSLFLSKYVAHQ